MKLSKPLLALILIASALLLLSGGRNAIAASPSPTPAQAASSNSEDGDSQSNSLLTIGTFVFVAITGVATALIAIFNFQLVGVTDEMKKAAGEAAEAAKQSATAAGLALQSDRPFLMCEQVRIEGFQPAIGILPPGQIPPMDAFTPPSRFLQSQKWG